MRDFRMFDIMRTMPLPDPAKFFLRILPLVFLAGCSIPSINLATSEPIKVDIDMRLDVYQYNNAGNAKTGTTSAEGNKTDVTVESRRRNRMADIQDFKNNRLIGEGHEGMLVIREMPEGEYGAYVKKTVDAENADRMEQMQKTAAEKKTSLTEIQTQTAEIWRKSAFKGEYIEIQQPDGSWKLTPKEG